MSTFLLSFIAGLLTSLSPCILPVLPLVVGSALQKHRLGPVVLCSGLVFSFVLAGLLLAQTGTILGADTSSLRLITGILLLGAGIFLLVPKCGDYLGRLLSPLSGKAERVVSRIAPNSLFGEFIIGSLLGIIWSPCSGPTLGAASAFALQSETLLKAAIVMSTFGVGASFPLLIVAYGSRELVLGSGRAKVLVASGTGKKIFGVLLLLVGVLLLSGLDKVLETFFLDYAPGWLIDLTSRY